MGTDTYTTETKAVFLNISDMDCGMRLVLVVTFVLGALVSCTVCSSNRIGSKHRLQVNETIESKDTTNATTGTVHFCCDEGHFFNTSNMGCEPDSSIIAHIPFQDHEGFPLNVPPGYQSVVGFPNCTSYALDPYNPDDAFNLLPNGHMKVNLYGDKLIHPDNYCLLVTGMNQIEAILCFQNEDQDYQDAVDLSSAAVFFSWLLPIGLIISSIFLAATLLVYCLVSELRDLLGKCLMCAISALCLGQLTTACVQLGTQHLPNWACMLSALLIQFFFLTAFMWLNVICINVFLTLCGRRDVVRLWIYGLYAWGVAGFFTLLALIRDLADGGHIDFLPKPNFGMIKCFFADDQALIFYFYGPTAVILSINVVLFCMAAYKLLSINKKSQAKMLQFMQYLKLFVLMGVTWIFEVISYFAKTDSQVGTYIWLVFDIINILQGIIIFIFFVCRRPVLSRLAAVFCGQGYAKKKYPELNQNEDTEYVNPDYNQEGNKPSVIEVQEDGIRMDGIK